MTEKRRDDDKRIDNLILTTDSLTDRITSLVSGVNVFKWLAAFVIPSGLTFAVWLSTAIYEIKTTSAVTAEKIENIDIVIEKYDKRLDFLEKRNLLSQRDR